jgi:hypothetical protein
VCRRLFTATRFEELPVLGWLPACPYTSTERAFAAEVFKRLKVLGTSTDLHYEEATVKAK